MDNFDLKKYLAEGKLTTASKAITEWDDQSIKDYADAMSKAFGNKPKEEEPKKPMSEMNGGYIEVMGPDFDDAVDLLSFVWNQWKNGSATEPEDIEPAKADILQYIKAVILK
jgi:hypothetical protein